MLNLKICADFLRAHSQHSGAVLRAGHAHELAAAFFGYRSAAACRTEVTYPLSNMRLAEVLFPNIPMMEWRSDTLESLSENVPSSNELAHALAEHLTNQGHYAGKVFIADKLNNAIIDYAEAELAFSITNGEGVSGAIAETNAAFDEMETHQADSYLDSGTLHSSISGTLYGDHDFTSDRAFYGDKIAFSSELTFEQVSGRIGFMNAAHDTTGHVDDSDYFDDQLHETA